MTPAAAVVVGPARASRASLAFMAAFGAAGWLALLLVTYLPGFGPEAARAPDALSFVLFFLVIVGVRGMAYRMLPEAVVSLDSAFYIAAVVCLGSATAGRLVALALTLDALLRLLRADAEGRRPGGTWVEQLLFVIYFGGMSGALLLAVGWGFGVDGRTLLDGPGRQLQVLGLVVTLGLTFLLCHYLLQGARLVLLGHRPRDYLRGMAVPGVVAEASLLPLAAVVVILYHPDRPLGFVLLGATYLLINLFFNRLGRAGASLARRVAELETLNRTAHALASTLQLPELIEVLARETIAAIPEAELLALSRLEHGRFLVDSYDRERAEFARHDAPAGEGLSAVVVARRQTLHLPDLRRSELVVGDPGGIRSWLGVPIVIYDDVVGVLSVQSRERDAFSADGRRLLEAIGAQAAAAIQNARLYELATVDGLTGLYVRRYFDSRLREELERCRRFDASCGLVLLDLDDFKRLNDTHGHLAGDRVLREIAGVVRRAMRGVDIAARYGGEELAFILPRTTIGQAHAVAERIRQDVAEARVVSDGQVLTITASLGVACYPESGGAEAADVIARADEALYRAKRLGKDRVEVSWGDAEPVAALGGLRRRPITVT